MAQFPAEPTWGDLSGITSQAFKASGKSYDDYLRRRAGAPIERSPIAEMYSSTPIGFAAKQILPHNVGETEIGRIIADVLPDNLKKGFKEIGLGGMSKAEKKAYALARASDAELRRSTVELGKVPVGDGLEEATLGPGNYRAKAAQAAGVVAADLASDGMRNIWWFLNAPQAIAQVAMFQGMRQASEKQLKAQDQAKYIGVNEPLIRARNLRMAAAAPAWIAASMGIGNFIRLPGYKAVVPAEDDPTQSANMAGELTSRYFLGRSGALLPYEEFRKERPDVSKAEYNAYKNYLFSGSSPIKATADGIHGPEVTFMGKSIPLATGILPMAAAVIGARRGIKRGIERVAAPKSATDRRGGYQIERELGEAYQAAKQELEESMYGGKNDAYRGSGDSRYGSKKEEVTEEDVKELFAQYKAQVERNEDTIAKSVIANTSAATAGAALSGYVLESLRRALKGRAPQEDEE